MAWLPASSAAYKEIMLVMADENVSVVDYRNEMAKEEHESDSSHLDKPTFLVILRYKMIRYTSFRHSKRITLGSLFP
jgi:hypothetical protein